MSTLTPTDVAEDLHISIESAVRRLRSGEIPGFRVGRYWRVDPEEYAAWKRGPARPADPNRIAPRSARSTAALNRRRIA